MKDTTWEGRRALGTSEDEQENIGNSRDRAKDK